MQVHVKHARRTVTLVQHQACHTAVQSTDLSLSVLSLICQLFKVSTDLKGRGTDEVVSACVGCVHKVPNTQQPNVTAFYNAFIQL